MGSINIVKGISGSGKSTMVYSAIRFLRLIGYKDELFHFINVEGKDVVVGIIFPELKVIFIGGEYEDGKVIRFNGYDKVTSKFVKAQLFSEFLRDNISKYSFVIEGAGITQSNRLRPLYLMEFVKPESISMYYFIYKCREDYDNRIIKRSGKKASKDTAWIKHPSFVWDAEESVRENVWGEKVSVKVFDVEDSKINQSIFGYDFIGKFIDEESALIYKDFIRLDKYTDINVYENFKKYLKLNQ